MNAWRQVSSSNNMLWIRIHRPPQDHALSSPDACRGGWLALAGHRVTPVVSSAMSSLDQWNELLLRHFDPNHPVSSWIAIINYRDCRLLHWLLLRWLVSTLADHHLSALSRRIVHRSIRWGWCRGWCRNIVKRHSKDLCPRHQNASLLHWLLLAAISGLAGSLVTVNLTPPSHPVHQVSNARKMNRIVNNCLFRHKCRFYSSPFDLNIWAKRRRCPAWL
ncbi:hypothetical protein AVEN_98729-1 [Araneus ventricosus]|uniref:Uncharacterized protein n=1 Tax=Araneus ventricosus TaxID=182803 RepID=A0A4Y2TNW3_ARAVE|nr:hypothetical protein AVEN_98729-1 [Araneus ventricosus]